MMKQHYWNPCIIVPVHYAGVQIMPVAWPFQTNVADNTVTFANLDRPRKRRDLRYDENNCFHCIRENLN